MENTPGKRVQIFRESKGYKTVTAFAEASGVKGGTLSSIESGRTAPSFDTIAAITTAFPDLNLDWLIHGTGSMLRDGKELTPVEKPFAVSEQTKLPNSSLSLVKFRALSDEELGNIIVENIKLREQLEAASETIADLRQDKEWLKEQAKKLKGKRLPAATEIQAIPEHIEPEPRMKIRWWGTAAYSTECVVRQMYPVSVPFTPSYIAR
jgi:transcriptional regulator with XRE-family HTH domain